MSEIETREISLADIENLACAFYQTWLFADNAAALARTVTRAERDGSASHGLFVCLIYCLTYIGQGKG